MQTWDAYRYFLAVVRRRTLRAAGKELGVNQSTVGRQIEKLEEALGAQLFEKRSDGFFLTRAGMRVLPLIENSETTLLSVERSLAGAEEKAEGLVRVAMPGALANHWLLPRLPQLLKTYPKLELDLLTGPEVVNLSRREADIALRLVRPRQKDLVARRCGAVTLKLMVSRQLVGKKPALKDVAKLPFVSLYSYAQSRAERDLLEKVSNLRPTLRSAAWSSVYYAVRSGLGCGIIPDFMEDKDLVAVADLASPPAPLWLVMHPDIARSARVRAVADFLISEMSVRKLT